MLEITKEYITKTLEEERLWKEGEADFIKFNEWNITLAKEVVKPFSYKVTAIHENGLSSWKYYKSMEEAFLHILNGFNENVYLKNQYNTISEYLNS